MAIKINYSKKTQNKQLSNVVLFTDEKFNISKIIKYIPHSEYSYIKDLLKTSDLKKKNICI